MSRALPVAFTGAEPIRARCFPCRVCRRGVPGGRRFCERHDETDLALSRLDEMARTAFRRCIDGGMRRGEALAIAKEDIALRAKLGLAVVPLRRAALVKKRARR